MAKDAVLQVRIDPKDKKQAEALYESMGTSLSEAVRMFVAQSIAEQRLPFTPYARQKKFTGRAYAALDIFANPAKRGSEREAWVSALAAKGGAGRAK